MSHARAYLKRFSLQHALVMLLAAVFVLGAFTPDALAQDVSTAAGKCKNYPGLTNKIAACIRLTLVDVSGIFFDGFYKLIQSAVAAFVTFAVSIYGVLVAMGMLEKPGRDAMVFLLKLSLVTYFTMNVHQIYDWNMALMDTAGEAVVSFIPQSGSITDEGDYSQLVCLQKMHQKASATPQEGNPIVGPWLAMDCLVDSVIGLKKENVKELTSAGADEWKNQKLAGEGMARGLVRFFFSSFQSSAMGIMIAVIGFVFIYGLIFLIIKALLTYLGGYLAVTFLLIFAPLFIPLILFRVTKEYFDKWLRLLISVTMQPVIMLIFITFSVVAIDLAIFSGNFSVMYKIAGEASRANGFNLNRYLDDHQVVLQKTEDLVRIKNEHQSQGCGPLTPDPNAGDSPTIRTFINPKLSQNGGAGASDNCRDYPIQFWHDSIDWEALANARNPAVQAEAGATVAQQISREVFSALILAGILVFMMQNLLRIVPVISNDLLGDFGVSPNLAAQFGSLPGQAAAGQAAAKVSGNLGTSIAQALTGKR